MTALLLILAKARQFPAYVPAAPGVPATVAGISSPSASEGGTLVFTVTFDGPSLIDSPLSYGVAGSAAPADIGAAVFSAGATLAGVTLTVPAGVSSFTVSFPVTDDIAEEVEETVVLTIGGQFGIGTIAASDPPPENAVTFGGQTLTFSGQPLTFN